MTDDIDREALRDIIAHWPIGSGYYTTSVGIDEAREIADAILTDFLPAYTERIRAEQRETDAQIAASNLDRPWVASETPGDIARAIRAGGIE